MHYHIYCLGFIRISCFMIIMLYPFIYFPCVLTFQSSVLDTCTHPGSPPGIILLLVWGVSLTPLDSHVQVMELRAWMSPVTASEWRSGSVDFLKTFQSSILPGPCMPLEFPLSKLVSTFILFILVLFLVYLYVSSLLYHSYVVYLLYSRICAY